MPFAMKTTSILMVAAVAAAAALGATQFMAPAAFAVTQNANGGAGGTAIGIFGNANARGGDANGGNGGTNFNFCFITGAC